MVTREEVESWGTKGVIDLLSKKIEDLDDDTIRAFTSNKVNGKAFVMLTESDLRELVPKLGERKQVQKIVESLNPKPTYVQADKVSSAPNMSSEIAHGSSKWSSQFSIPEFSRRTMENLSKGEIKRSTRVEIVNTIALQMWSHTHYPTSQEYTGVLHTLVAKYPVLKDKFGNGIGSWKEQLRQKFSNMRRPPHPAAGNSTPDATDVQPDRHEADDTTLTEQEETTTYDEMEPSTKRARVCLNPDDDARGYTDNLMLLHKELEKEKPCRKTMRSLMSETFEGRRAWIDNECAPVVDILNRFPPLNSTKYLYRELAGITGVSNKFLDEMKTAWTALQPKIVKHILKEGESSSKIQALTKEWNAKLKQCDPDDSEFMKENRTLEYLSALLCSRTFKGEKSILHFLDSDYSLEEQVSKCKFNFPYIAVIGLEYVVVAERITVCSCSSLVEALAATVAVYYTFNIQYPLSLKPVLVFVEKVLIGMPNSEKIPASVNRLYSALEAIASSS